MMETVTYRLVREWRCPDCGGNNFTAESDVIEEECAVCWKCTSEIGIENFEEEVE